MKVAPRLVLAGTLVVWAAPALASQSPSTSDVTEGTLKTREGKNVVPVPLKHTEVAIRIDGFLADVEVEQTFQNPYDKKIEAIYLFPLPSQSAVNDLEIVTSGRTIRGEIKLKEDAKQIYRAAKTKGHVAALLVQERPNLFTQSVANIEPGAEVKVRLRYVQALAYDEGAYELVFPMVAGPRHVPKTSKLTKDEAAAVQAAVLPPGMRSAHDIGVSVEIDAGVPIHGVRSPSHAIETSAVSTHESRVKIGAGDTIPNKDFILRYDVAGDSKPEFAVIPHRAGDAGSFFLMAQPPVDAADSAVTPKEMVFVVDTSSSMQGKPLEKAKEAIRTALAGMRADDTFQIIRFDDSASALGASPIANKPRNVEHALTWLGQLQAGGGTDMTAGIRAALAFPHDPARLRIVVFLTDGFIGNEDEILALVQEQLGESRLFSFGVGSAVNRYLLEEMAALGRGTVQVVRPDEDTAAAVEKFHDRIAKPLLTDVTIDWNGLAVEEVSPARIPDLFAGQPLVLSGRYAKGGNATISVKGKLAGRAVSFDVPVMLPETRERPAVAAIWARSRITELSRQQLRGEKPEIKQKIIDLALSHRLMSTYTSFVAVDATKVTSGGAAETVAVPVEVPEGLHSTQGDYGGTGSGVVYGIGGGGYGEMSVGHGSYGVAAKPAPAPTVYPMHYMKTDPHAGSDGDLEIQRLLSEEIEPGRADPKPADKAEPKPPEPPPSETTDAKMRADVDKCWTLAMEEDDQGTIDLSVDFDDVGAPRSIAVRGVSDAALDACVKSMAKKWRAAKNKRLSLKVVK